MKKSNGWDDLHMVDTIYEETEPSSSPSPTPSPSLSSPSPKSLQSFLLSSCLEKGRTDAIINVNGCVFRLHKEPLMKKSGYLKRLLTSSSEITISPPLNITAEAFEIVANLCYDRDVIITPFNVAAARTASELLQMTGGGRDRDLRDITETYFRHVVVVNRDYATTVFRTAVALLPESEETAALVSRSIEALSVMEDGEDVADVLAEIRKAEADKFQVVVDSMQYRCEQSHDLLYGIVDLYLKGKGDQYTTEEERIRICNSIDCTKLTPHFLMHAVQNPRMPLRFLVRAMMAEQLSTRHSLVSSRSDPVSRADTIGSAPRRDAAAVREVAELKAAMDATSCRIKSLEKELICMKKFMMKTNDDERVDTGSTRVDQSSARSASFRVVSSTKKVERGQRGSVSSIGDRYFVESERRKDRTVDAYSVEGDGHVRNEKKIGWKLLNKLKYVFRKRS